ncbi:hypothetical protein ACVWWK_003076 [Bradyrhizobium sp. LB9.1b]
MRAIKRLLAATVTVAGLSASTAAHANCDIRQYGDYNQATCLHASIDYEKLAAVMRRQQEEERISHYSSPSCRQTMPPQVQVVYGGLGYPPPRRAYMGFGLTFAPGGHVWSRFP